MILSELANLLACPLCKGKVDVRYDEVRCLNCGHRYPIEQGIIDLRPPGLTRCSKGRDQWRLEAFERAYQKKGYYKDSFGWAEHAGIPRIVEEYRYPRVKGKLIDWLKPKDNNFILDIGCGIGFLLFNIMEKYQRIQLNLTGLDIARSNIQWLIHRKAEEKKDNLIGLLGDAESLPFRDGHFDIVITSETLEHILNPVKAIKEISRVLKKGGRLFITTPSGPDVNFWKTVFWLPRQFRRFLKRKADTNTDAYDKPLNKRELKSYLYEANFEITKFEQGVLMPHESYFQFFPYPLTWLIIKIALFLENRFESVNKHIGLHYIMECYKPR